MDKELIKLHAKIELARREFFYYCNLKAPDFYKLDRKYLIELCNELQQFYEDPEAEVLIVNMPPRHGKSRTAGLFVEWILGKNKNEKIMTGSYNETLSTMFSKNVRDNIQESKVDKMKPVYTDVFPNVKIKQGDGAMNLWSLEGGYNNYLATSPTGTATGFGCSLMIIDDLIKNAAEAYNEDVLQKHWDWFTNTMLSRLEENGKIIIIMTRWATSDLAGRILKHYTSKIKHITMKALQDDDESMLCDEILSKKSYDSKCKAMNLDITSANYQQEPIDIKGRLYNNFKTYNDIPEFERIESYTDTADTGKDYLCSIIYGVYQKLAYVLDIYYTQDAMEITEPELAKRLNEHNASIAHIESNNGGRSFAREVRRLLLEKYNTRKVVVKWFHQSKNKQARIHTNSARVQENILFPVDWANRYPEFYASMVTYQSKGKNKHDDAQDASTGVIEKMENRATFGWKK